jgi:hypothetical protein
MQKAATTQTTQHSSKRTTHQQPSASGQITAVQVWQQLSATQQQVLQRTLANVCHSLISRTTCSVESEEAHDDRS